MWDFRLGFQPGYSDSWVTSAPATLKAASIREAALRRAELVELRWALAGAYADYAAFLHLDRGKVGGCLHQAIDLCAHGHHSVGYGVQGADEVEGCAVVYGL